VTDKAKVGLLVVMKRTLQHIESTFQMKGRMSGHVIICEKERVEGEGIEDYDFLDLIDWIIVLSLLERNDNQFKKSPYLQQRAKNQEISTKRWNQT
jgi:hypothetical protein